MTPEINILSTRPLDPVLIARAADRGINITTLSFIETIPIQSIDVQQEIEQALMQDVTVVFTSMNAVEAVHYYQEAYQPAWNIYCIGTTTQHLVQQYFGEDSIAGTAADAAALAAQIVDDGVADEVLFFCGDQRREELPALLRDNDIEVNEITVYHTIETPHKIGRLYNGILFFSPSAVVSFFRQNKVPAATMLFSIGQTTAKELLKYSNNKVILSDQPGKTNLVNKMMEYFTG